MAHLAGHLHHRRREVDSLPSSLWKLTAMPPLRLDAVELLEEVDVEIGAAELAVGDALQAEVLLQL